MGAFIGARQTAVVAGAASMAVGLECEPSSAGPPFYDYTTDIPVAVTTPEKTELRFRTRLWPRCSAYAKGEMTVKMPTLRDRWIASCLALVFLAPAPGVAQTQPEAAQTQQQAAQEPLPPNTNPAQHVVYPAQGQSQDQALSDQLKAYRWATQQTNWDPYKAYDQLAEQGYVSKRNAEEAQGGGVRGAAGGALAGLAIGAIAGDAGKGAAIGAVAGGLTGGIRSRRKQQAAQAEMDQAVDAFKRQFSLWDRNYVACLQGLGYTVT